MRRCGARGHRLPARTPHRCAADHDRRRAAVIPDRDVLIVGQQRIVGTEQAADIGGVEHGGVEIGVVADRRRQQHRRRRACGISERRARFASKLRQAARATPRQCAGVPAHISALSLRAVQAARDSGGSPSSRPAPAAARRSRTRSSIRHPDGGDAALTAEDSVGQVLDREIGSRHHNPSQPSQVLQVARSGSSNEQEPKLMANCSARRGSAPP